jgi:hypothetical protein
LETGKPKISTVDSKGCVKVRTNFYSTPLKPGTRPQAKLLPAYVEIWQERECVARHERSFGRYEQVLDLEHYLDLLEKKPGALAGASKFDAFAAPTIMVFPLIATEVPNPGALSEEVNSATWVIFDQPPDGLT